MIGVVGLGFVGLTTALGFCEKTGFDVYAVEKNKERFEIISDGKVPFYEPGISEALAKYLDKRLHLMHSMSEMIDKCSVIFYCVGTPADVSGSADLSILKRAINEGFSGYLCREYKVIVIKSTVPPGTTDVEIRKIVDNLENRDNIGIANNPEFLREGCSWEDFIKPDRIVIGQSDDKAGQAVAALYEGFGAPVFRVSLNTGEYIKYLSNTLLATMISYSNEMSVIADFVGDIDVKSAFNVLHMDKRWSGDAGQPTKMASYVYPGCGYGGYCLPKDTEAMYAKAVAAGANPQILSAVIQTNSDIRPHKLAQLMRLVNKEQKIGVLGLSFKPGSDDVRDTPAKYFVDGLLENGYRNIIAHDPIAIEEFKKHYSFPIAYEQNLDKVITDCDAIVIVTAWDDYKKKADKIKEKLFVDARYCL